MTGSSQRHVLIVGAGQAAASAIQSLRQWKYDGPITLIGDEPHLPYQRPPLSKAYLKGELAEERLYLKNRSWYEVNRVRFLEGARATGIDRSGKSIELDGGETIEYDALVLCTGARARALSVPGANLDNVFKLRSLMDVDSIDTRMVPGKKVVIVGAGYIGLEVAAVAAQLGLAVTVLEYAPRVLARVTSDLISEFYTREHEAHGVNIRTNTRLARLEGKEEQVVGARLANGEIIPADLVLCGIGITPNTELVEQAGIYCNDGIVVDRDARTSDQSIFAAGDCTRRPLVHYNRSGRLESVHNAIEQGKLVAAALTGQPRPAEDCPWFWSDQYDLKLQIAGLSMGYDRLVVRGEIESRKFAVFYLKQGTVIATDAVNSPAEFLASKKLIKRKARLNAKLLADTSVPIDEIARKCDSPSYPRVKPDRICT